jgi:hypothetical protein
MKNSLSPKAWGFLTAALGVILVSGITASVTLAADTLPAGFKKGDLAPEPSSPSVSGVMGSMAPVMDQEPIASGPAPAISTRERSRFGTPPVVSCRCSMRRSPFQVKTICLRL